jgi:hypothetical protein
MKQNNSDTGVSPREDHIRKLLVRNYKLEMIIQGHFFLTLVESFAQIHCKHSNKIA